AGETFGIVGESGCGKTTLGRLLVGLEQPTSGSVVFDGRALGAQRGAEFRRRRRDLQMMFQDSAAALDPRMPVSALVAEPLAAQRIGTGRERQAMVAELLDAVGLPRAAARRYPHEFSGGQRQRIAMARALALKPKVIVADEPVSALDVSVQAQILNLLQDLRRELNLTFVIVSHNLAVVEHMADRVAVMYLGRVIEAGPAEQIFGRPRHPYTKTLLDSVLTPETGRGLPEFALGPGFPNPLEPPSGCSFHPRCPKVMPECAAARPAALHDGEAMVECHLYSGAPETVS
ncbi:MAG TPA: ABC transporter ATP-binding protein, partial [Stellaceae bacterium]|nr:ABC transporter ATP-binding protein [Stellaceae bacterium]